MISKARSDKFYFKNIYPCYVVLHLFGKTNQNVSMAEVRAEMHCRPLLDVISIAIKYFLGDENVAQ